ncbi:hypothetical protein [Ferrimonas aestuarii]|uniref:Uncharacterized protein n=1 Tax=Ferrimonas aestuarii TaxID=2569539 RepID=A0A4V5NZU6_9GAMM|nr:hypothetical protein [Ferrimonas aestuarii]TKB58358.1 hypothetical protein FCL42_01005 [Ferrimonas aestuarii]
MTDYIDFLIFTSPILIVPLILYFWNNLRFKARSIIRLIFYSNPLAQLSSNKFFSNFIPGLCGFYFLCLDVWGDDWDLIKNHKETHELIFSLLMIGAAIVIFFRSMSDYFEEESEKKKTSFSEFFTMITAKIVSEKLKRFKQSATTISKNGDTFKSITKPRDQINIILGEIDNLLYNVFDVKKSGVCTTIMRKDPKTENWHYIFNTNNSWKHTKASTLIDNRSTASESLHRGESIFHASKEESSKKGLYYLSDRDKRTGDGSVFCYPAVITNPDYSDEFVISIVTYGKRLCRPHDEVLEDAIDEILTNLCSRIELELTLFSIYDWKFEFHTAKSRGAA